MLSSTFWPLMERVLQLSDWTELRLDAVPKGLVPVLSEGGRQQALLQSAFLTLVLHVIGRGYGGLLGTGDFKALLYHTVAACWGVLDKALSKTAFEVLAEATQPLQGVEGFRTFAMDSILPTSIQVPLPLECTGVPCPVLKER